MEVEFDIATALASLVPYIVNKLSKIIKAQGQDSNDVSKAVAAHLIEVVNWMSNVQFFGMGTPQSTEEATVALDMYTEPRRFQSAADHKATKHESDLLLGSHHILLLGEAGSGKTTTFKRLALAMLKQEPVGTTDVLQYPIVIRLRELQEGESLFSKIAEIFGLSIELHEIVTHQSFRDTDGRLGDKETRYTEMRIGNDKVENVIPKFLDEGRALLLLDGLDELRSGHRAKIRDEIVNLGRRLATSRIIASCRSGDYTQDMDGFAVLEICPLSENQILAIKEKWLGPDDTKFMGCLQALPYFDVADRPLLLTQLLLLYRRYGYLPEQPSQVYSRLINLLLEEWDAQRGIKRDSKYAGFSPRRKAEFLALLSYQLTYRLQMIKFKEADLVEAYLIICKRFNLPANEAKQVAREIQTHSGIIVLGPKDIYEFCHLSLQEYLCADYIVRAPLDTQVTKYLSKYSAPLAIAVALSSNPSDWFGSLILSFGNLKNFDEGNMASFLSRILLESPSFHVSELLGFAMLMLFKHYGNSASVRKFLEQIIEISCVDESIAKALKWYTPISRGQVSTSFVEVSLSRKLEKVHKLNLPSEGMFPKRILPKLKLIAGSQLFAKG